MRIPLERSGTVPLYTQIERFLLCAITSGNLPVRTRLPSARQLAADLGLSRMTVETAYAGLEAEGLVTREIGRGTFVLPPASPAMPQGDSPESWPQWQRDLTVSCASWRDAAGAPSAGDDAIRFDTGTGDARRFPVEELRRTMLSVLRRDGRSALEYGDPRGYAPLRKTMAQVLSAQGLQASENDVLITSGSQQGIALVAQLLLRPGDTVVVERPTYGAVLGLFRAIGLRIVDVPVDRHGMQVELLEAILQRSNPRLIYTIPNFQNPTGSCMSTQRRKELVLLAERYDVPVLEDDFVGDLRYDGRALPPLKALDRSSNVIYVSTFSKMLMPGLRAGLVLADGPVLEILSELKRLTDLATSNMIQRALDAYVSVGRYEAHLRRSRRVYAKRRDAMARAVERSLPAGTTFDMPSGGLFLWIRLPEGHSATAILARARARGVRIAPGGEFFADGEEGDRFIRLNFAAFTPEEIDHGVSEMGKAIGHLR
jgi:GntR family transcriptional regulator / MocR family aminotransferase